jgi:two-component system copper resistance phosphate regulon response regulator CusR
MQITIPLMRLLVVEDYQPLREAIVQGLREANYAVDEAATGPDGLWRARSNEHDVIILDLMLPGLDGLSILKTLRENSCPACILILTAKDTSPDKVKGLELGADDYLVKPFVFAELLARVKTLIRRKYETKTTTIRIADLEINISHRTVRRGTTTIDLSGREYALLEYLAMNANRTVSRSDIWQHVYDFYASLESNVVDVYVGLLRKKIERPGSPRLIHTRRGQGYMVGELAEAGAGE